MRKINKKILISILTSVIVMITIVATTFAWVGIFTYANTDNFKINLKVNDLDVNYFLTISATDSINRKDYGEEADLIQIERQILKNQHKWSDSAIDEMDEAQVEYAYKFNAITTPATTSIDENGQLTDFVSVNLSRTDGFEYITPEVGYLKFDLFLSVNNKEGIKEDETGKIPDDVRINCDVYLTELANTLEGMICEYRLFNKNQFSTLPSANEILKTIPDNSNFKLNSKNATRIALCMYNPINLNDTYNETETPIKTYIYQGGTTNPSMDNDVYNLGGNLPEDSNTALKELLVIRPEYKNTNNITYRENYEKAYQEAIKRIDTDLELTESNSKLWKKPINPEYTTNSYGQKEYNYLGVHAGEQTKMKVTVYFWFEGWDADCLLGIDQKSVNMNLTFTAGLDD